MELYLNLIVIAIILVAIVMGVFGLKFFHDRGSGFNVESDPEKYRKIKQDGIYSVYSDQNHKGRKNQKNHKGRKYYKHSKDDKDE